MTNYSLGDCIICGKSSALKDGKCPKCQDIVDFSDIFTDIFKPIMGTEDKKDE